ncbi:MAG: hypothetical protein DRN27_05010 [Thermoplasmata archaeon]|nr:MAG: hypothetical protein DRN27_05010 [Thermoplasmata archaeon]
MGFSVTGSHVIIFIASVIAASAVSGVILTVTYGINSGFSDQGERIQDLLDTDFCIINDPENIPSAGSDYLFYLKNIGSKQLITSNVIFNVFIDGELIGSSNYNFSINTIKQGEISTLYIDTNEINLGDHTLRIVGPQAIEDEFIFTIT